jgi:hypothetical protein
MVIFRRVLVGIVILVFVLFFVIPFTLETLHIEIPW